MRKKKIGTERTEEERVARETLERFLAFPLESSRPVMEEFAKLPGAVAVWGEGKKSFVYVPGKREDRIVLAAHADTVWDEIYTGTEGAIGQKVVEKKGVYSGKIPYYGLGADDRAGCAILWLLRNSGHSLLVLDGEEYGEIGANHLAEAYPAIMDELNNHGYIIQPDRRNATEYKTYHLPITEEFRKFIEDSTGYTDAGKASRTDIVVLCERICGVNLSVGYHDEHREYETLVFSEWFNTFRTIKEMIGPEQKRYPLFTDKR